MEKKTIYLARVNKNIFDILKIEYSYSRHLNSYALNLQHIETPSTISDEFLKKYDYRNKKIAVSDKSAANNLIHDIVAAGGYYAVDAPICSGDWNILKSLIARKAPGAYEYLQKQMNIICL